MPIVRAETLRNTESGPVALLGNGPSLNRWPLDRLSCPTIGINTSHELVKSKFHSFVTASMVSQLNNGMLQHCKAVFFPFRYKARLTKAFLKSARDLLLVPVMEMPKQQKLQWNLAQGSDASFGGIFAIHVALFLGFKQLFLIGYDEHNNERHFRNNEIENNEIADRKGTHLSWYPLVKSTTDTLGVEIFVANRESAIRCFEFSDPPTRKKK